MPQALLPRIEPRAQRLLGITEDDAVTIGAVAEAYNRANPANLLGILTLLARIATDEPPVASSVARWSPPTAITRSIPRMTPPAEMSADLRWLRCDNQDETGATSGSATDHSSIPWCPASIGT